MAEERPLVVFTWVKKERDAFFFPYRLLCKLFAQKKGFRFKFSETLVIPAPPARLELATL